VTERLDMNALIRERAGRGAEPSRTLHALAPDLPPGRSSVGVGGTTGLAPRTGPHDDLNEKIRTAANVARGRLTIDDVLGNW
jgi:hypothetical protein